MTQQGDLLCSVEFDLVQSTDVREDTVLNGTARATGGIPLDVGLPDLFLELPNGRRAAIEVIAVEGNGPNESYRIRGRMLPPARP
jgi:hypothetical protein